MSAGQAAILRHLQEAAATVPEISEATEIRRPVVYRSIARFERDELVESAWVKGESGRVLSRYEINEGRHKDVRRMIADFDAHEAKAQGNRETSAQIPVSLDV